jgi:predicted dithiol-disulfide oxidoreductase (DUF899 family)
MTAPSRIDAPAEHRVARDRLLSAEADLRAHVEEVAAMRRALPPGAPPREDYVFEDARSGERASLSQLFTGEHRSLVLYSLMYGPDDAAACAMCSCLLDSLDGAASHAAGRVDLAVVAKAPPEKLRAWADARGWRDLRLLSSRANSYNRDWGGEDAGGAQLPMLNVWTRTPDGVRHFWASDLFGVRPAAEGQHPRHLDMIWPLWNLLDLTPDGRGDLMPGAAPRAAAG